MKFKWLMKEIGTVIYNNRSNIEFVVGTGMVVAGTGIIMSKAEAAVEIKNEMEYQIKEIELKDENNDWDSDRERNKACFDMAKSTVKGYAKTYALGVGVELTGLVLMGVSHATDRSEIASLGAALTSTTLQFAQYRQRVKEELGEEKDEEFLMGKIEETVLNEDGTAVTSTKPATIPDHSFLMDETHPDYSDEGFMNFDFLEDHERWINDRLWTEGFLTENDIRRDAHAPISVAAAEGDWGITAVDDDGNRNYISYGIHKDTERAKAFRDGTEKSFLVILNNMEPNISKKLYRLNKFHKDVLVSK